MPPIPTDTPEGARAHAIADTIRALQREGVRGLELQPEQYAPIGRALGVPALFVAASHLEDCGQEPMTPRHFAEYIGWRYRLAARQRKAVA